MYINIRCCMLIYYNMYLLRFENLTLFEFLLQSKTDPKYTSE